MEETGTGRRIPASRLIEPGGGKGSPSVDWWLPDDSPAELAAFVNLESQDIWIMSFDEVKKYAQQHSRGGYHLYMYIDKNISLKKDHLLVFLDDFEPFRLENRVGDFFGM